MVENATAKKIARGNDQFSLGKISEIARRALTQLVTDNKPALPPIYEKAFYNMALKMGESELVNGLMDQMPVGQAASVMVQGLSAVITALNRDMQQYRQGISAHSDSLAGKQQDIKATVPPEVWNILEANVGGLLAANQTMRAQLEAAEARLQDQEQQVTSLQRKSRCDALTGALNRLALEEDLADECNRARRYKRPFSIIMSDIDFFKKVNDTYGHAMGDEVLKTFVKVIHKSLREVDVVYRYGGEEFLLLLPETDADGAMIAAERVRACVEGHVLRSRADADLQIRITASLGVAMFDAADVSHQALIERADQALYAAKENGRNRVVRAPAP